MSWYLYPTITAPLPSLNPSPFCLAQSPYFITPSPYFIAQSPYRLTRLPSVSCHLLTNRDHPQRYPCLGDVYLVLGSSEGGRGLYSPLNFGGALEGGYEIAKDKSHHN